ncbi:MAG: DNA internalization-related competence protein ComEC/Rec2 [Polyangiaceae bacterium]|nr:DNA internalization-related competence protein ComEC/Rec2 [Polyangiaceae bacterium]
MRGTDRVLLLALTAFTGGAFALGPLAATLSFGGALVILRAYRAATTPWLGVLTVVFAISAARAGVSRSVASATYDQARALASPPASCSLTAEVAGSPQVRGELVRATVVTLEGACGELVIPPGTRLDVRATASDLTRGDRVAISGTFAPAYAFDNPGSLPSWLRVARTGTALSGTAKSLELLERGRGLSAWIDRARAHVRDRIVATYHPEAAALGRALVLGETDLDPEVNDAFRATGLSHILAVSGTHLVVAVMSLAGALRAVLLGVGPIARRLDVRRVAAALAIPCAWLYADFAGGSGSVLRAAAMLTAILLARVLERRPSTARSLSAALLFGVACDPIAIGDVSFTLSTAATAGLLTLSRPIAHLLGARGPSLERGEVSLLRRAWSPVATAVAATLAATLCCAPLTALLSAELPLAGLAANLIAAPLGELFALPFAILHAMVSWVPALERGAADAASGALRVVLAIARLARDAELTAPVPAPRGMHYVVGGVGAAWAAYARGRSRRLVVCAALFALGAVELAARRGPPDGVLEITVLDVGQGDAILVELPEDGAMLIDAGGLPGQPLDIGERVVAPTLRARRITRLEVLVVSHPHPDHYLGVPAALKRVESVGELWHNGYPGDDARGRAMREIIELATGKGARVLGPDDLCGQAREIGGARVEVLGPCPSLDPALSVNDGSLVLKITHGARSALLMGDAEEEAELRLLEAAPDLSADLLKVGHHGSRTSTTPELLRAVDPTHAVISCGVRNTFGHPHGEVTAALEEHGVAIARTDATGAFTWSTDGRDVWVVP